MLKTPLILVTVVTLFAAGCARESAEAEPIVRKSAAAISSAAASASPAAGALTSAAAASRHMRPNHGVAPGFVLFCQS